MIEPAYSGLLVSASTIVVAILAIGFIFARLYQRASKEVSFVRTGLGGQKVIMNGGALVLPILHEVIPVNMNTLRLAVKRAEDQALITRDRMRVDVVAEFYVRAQPTEESIANAAQTLGQRTMQPDLLKDLIEGKFVDALRSVASELSMEELHEKRTDFVQKVQQAVSEDLLKNGLELESVSLTGLDQTSKEFFNPNNAFDAEGLTQLTQEIERRRKIRNDIEQDTEVQISQKNLEAEKQQLELTRDQEYARLSQQREVEIRRASQATEIDKERAEQQKLAEQAKIQANREVETSKIQMERDLEQQRIEKEKTVKTQDIERDRAVELAEKDKVIAIIDKDKEVSTQDIERDKAIELAKQDQSIAIAEKSKEQSLKQAEADEAKAKAAQKEESIKTSRDTEIANRQKQIELIDATKQAEREAIKIKVAAEAQKNAAEDSAEAIRTEAKAAADQLTINAHAEAEQEKMKAEALEMTYKVEAEGQRAINEAKNLLSPEQVAMQIKSKLIDNLDKIIRESVKPLENIEGIKIVNFDGFNGGGSVSHGGGNGADPNLIGGPSNLSDQVVNSALKYRAQAPILDSLLNEIGINGGDINTYLNHTKGNDVAKGGEQGESAS